MQGQCRCLFLKHPPAPSHCRLNQLVAVSRHTRSRLYRQNQAVGFTVESVTLWLDRALETAWLTAALVVPLVVLSETSFISFTELPKTAALRLLSSFIAIALLIRLAAAVATGDGPILRGGLIRSVESAVRWSVRNPANALITAAVAIGIVTGISTAVSISPQASLWGKEPGNDGYGLYTTAAYIVLFMAIALRLRTRSQAWRLWGAITVSGLLAALIGVAQHFGISPLGISATYDGGSRVTGPSGNPIFFGSLLVLVVPVAMGGSLAFAKAHGTRPAWWAATILAAYVLVLAAVFTVSRGPWLGLIAGMFVFGGMALATVGWRHTAKMLLAVSVASVAVFVTINFSGSRGAAGDPTEPAAPGAGMDTSVYITDRLASHKRTSTLETRLDTWAASFEAVVDGPEVPGGNNLPHVVRVMFGYGPDTFRYVFPLKASGSHLERWLTSAAHNDPINRLVELGFIGVAAYGSLAAVALVVAWKIFGVARKSGSPPLALLVTGLVAALAGRFVEQNSGIAQVGDTTVFWLILGLLVAIYMICRSSEAPSAVTTVRPREGRVVAGHAGGSLTRGALVVAISAAAMLAVFLAWQKNVDYLRADALAAEATAVAATRPSEAVGKLDQAIRLAPDIIDYRHSKAAILHAAANAAIDPQRHVQLLREAHAVNIETLEINPLSLDSNFIVGYSAWSLAQAGDVMMAAEAIAAYERLASLAPRHPLVLERLQALYAAVEFEPVAQ